jgi:hypothetical protein
VRRKFSDLRPLAGAYSLVVLLDNPEWGCRIDHCGFRFGACPDHPAKSLISITHHLSHTGASATINNPEYVAMAGIESDVKGLDPRCTMAKALLHNKDRSHYENSVCQDAWATQDADQLVYLFSLLKSV